MVSSVDAYLPVASLCLLAPSLDGPPTGGTLYNRSLLDALQRAGAQARAIERLPEDAADALGAGELLLVDSLYLEQLPALRARLHANRVWLLLHYLPSQVRLGRAVDAGELDATERGALAAADAYVVTSQFMAEQLVSLGVARERVLCVEPGVAQVTREPRADGTLHAAMLAAVVEGKGLLGLLRALAQRLRSEDRLTLDVAGSLELEPAYAAECRALIAARPQLQRRVSLHGALPHHASLALLARSSLLVSSSRMESFGMALAEARAAGVPILALEAGNAAAHVEASAGGTLRADLELLSDALVQLAREPQRLAVQDARARSALRARDWDEAATALLAALRGPHSPNGAGHGP